MRGSDSRRAANGTEPRRGGGGTFDESRREEEGSKAGGEGIGAWALPFMGGC